MHLKLDALAEKGFVVLRDYDGPPIPKEEWMSLEYMDWKSGGDTNFAPIASALGEMECAGFWDHGKPDKDGIWTKNAAQCPTLVKWVESVGANFGRVRIIKLNPNTEAEALTRNLHLDDRSEERRVGKECRSLCDWSSDVCSSDLRPWGRWSAPASGTTANRTRTASGPRMPRSVPRW